jgi:hypothetical protein
MGKLSMKISVIDWYPSFNAHNEMLWDVIEQALETKLCLVASHLKADIILVGPYGQSHKSKPDFINSAGWKLYFTGENSVPDFRFVHHSLTFIRHDFNGRNFRLPLWWMHLSYPEYRESVSFDRIESTEFFDTNRPLSKYQSLEKVSEIIAVFNHPDPLRLWTIQALNQRLKVEKYGQCFGNGFAWGDAGYQRKIQLISGYTFNYCPENTVHDGYFTEKILHARLAGCIPIVYADKYVNLDFNPNGLINIYDFDSVREVAEYVAELAKDESALSAIINEPVCTNMPDMKLLSSFIYESFFDFANGNLQYCTDEILPVSEVDSQWFPRAVRKLAALLR